MRIVSYYTPLYAQEAAGLIKSMEKLGFKEYDVEQRPQIGTWEQNTQIKASFIYEKLLVNDCVVWTDADSRMRQGYSNDDIDEIFEDLKKIKEEYASV